MNTTMEFATSESVSAALTALTKQGRRMRQLSRRLFPNERLFEQALDLIDNLRPVVGYVVPTPKTSDKLESIATRCRHAATRYNHIAYDALARSGIEPTAGHVSRLPPQALRWKFAMLFASSAIADLCWAAFALSHCHAGGGPDVCEGHVEAARRSLALAERLLQ